MLEMKQHSLDVKFNFVFSKLYYSLYFCKYHKRTASEIASGKWNRWRVEVPPNVQLVWSCAANEYKVHSNVIQVLTIIMQYEHVSINNAHCCSCKVFVPLPSPKTLVTWRQQIESARNRICKESSAERTKIINWTEIFTTIHPAMFLVSIVNLLWRCCQGKLLWTLFFTSNATSCKEFLRFYFFFVGELSFDVEEQVHAIDYSECVAGVLIRRKYPLCHFVNDFVERQKHFLLLPSFEMDNYFLSCFSFFIKTECFE